MIIHSSLFRTHKQQMLSLLPAADNGAKQDKHQKGIRTIDNRQVEGIHSEHVAGDDIQQQDQADQRADFSAVKPVGGPGFG